MKRLITRVLLLLALPFLFSCESALMEPADLSQGLQHDARTAACSDYFYTSKSEGTVTFGKAWGQLILVGFLDGMTLEDRQLLLATVSGVERVEGETYTDTGVLTIVRLQENSTCFEAEKVLKALQKHPAVRFANPVFDPLVFNPGSFDWVGLSNEFLVSIEGNGTLAQLEQLVQQTNTEILFSLSEDIHFLGATKESDGSVLEIVSHFNIQPFITSAEPNLVFQFAVEPVPGQRSTPLLISSTMAQFKKTYPKSR